MKRNLKHHNSNTNLNVINDKSKDNSKTYLHHINLHNNSNHHRHNNGNNNSNNNSNNSNKFERNVQICRNSVLNSDSRFSTNFG